MTKLLENDTCEAYCINEKAVQQVRDQLLPQETVLRLAETFKVMGEQSRVGIIQALSLHELCVCDLAMVLGMTSSAVSHQLRTLRNLKLVKFRREGKTVFYSLDDEHIINLFQEALKHVRHLNG
ncbi:MAG TPA: metalloregulator ArsR/SmtB family transcription factor [Bacillota bacterium]|nr:metalloregulator ArsR/SmtB family transcription factor [Bacillota bacterium]